MDRSGQAPALAKQVVAGGAQVVNVGALAWNAELFGAVCRAVYAAGGITTVHLPPSDMAVVNAVRAAELGVTLIEHHYGYAESAVGGMVQHLPPDYSYNDDAQRFRYAGQVWEDGNPLENLRFMYALGAQEMVGGKIVRRGGIRWTIKEGVVFDNRTLADEVVRMVAESKKNWTDPVPALFKPMPRKP